MPPPPPPELDGCEAWQPTPPIAPLPDDACLTFGSLPFDPEPPSGPFPAVPGAVVCGSGWGHGASPPAFDWSIELETTTGEQDLSLTPDAEVLIISNSYQSSGSSVFSVAAATGELLDVTDISDPFWDAETIAAIDAERWFVGGTHDSGLDSESIVALIEFGEATWTHTFVEGDTIALSDMLLSQTGDIVVASGYQPTPSRVDRLSAAGELLWTWHGPATASSPSLSEAADGRLIFTGSPEGVVLGADGETLDSFTALSYRQLASLMIDYAMNEVLVVGSGRGDDSNYSWIELARWVSPAGQASWTREHRRALSWNGSTSLYSALYDVQRHPCGGFVAAGLIPLQAPDCGYQPWVVAFDDYGEIIWADRIHRCAGRPVLAVGPEGDVWLLTQVSTTGTTPLLRHYPPPV